MEIIPYRTLFLLVQDVANSGTLPKLVEALEVSGVSDTIGGASILLYCWQEEMEMMSAPARHQIMHHLECIGIQGLPMEFIAQLPWR